VLAFIRFFDNIFSLNSLNYEFLNGIIPSWNQSLHHSISSERSHLWTLMHWEQSMLLGDISDPNHSTYYIVIFMLQCKDVRWSQKKKIMKHVEKLVKGFIFCVFFLPIHKNTDLPHRIPCTSVQETHCTTPENVLRLFRVQTLQPYIPPCLPYPSSLPLTSEFVPKL
jgi:hypothetical protein